MSAQPSEFSLRALVREVISEHGIVNDPQARHQVAREVLRRIPPKHRAESHLQAMAVFVQEINRGNRAYLRPVPPAPETAEDEARMDGVDTPAGPQHTPSANSANSATQAAIRRVGKLLRETVYAVVPEKALEDYDPDEAEAAATYLEKQSAELATKAARYRQVAAHMRALGVKRVRDLPMDLLADVFIPSGKAA